MLHIRLPQFSIYQIFMTPYNFAKGKAYSVIQGPSEIDLCEAWHVDPFILHSDQNLSCLESGLDHSRFIKIMIGVGDLEFRFRRTD